MVPTLLTQNFLYMKWFFLLSFALFFFVGAAQIPDAVNSPRIKSVQLFTYGNPLGYPVMRLNSSDRLELHFDDLDASVKSYSYTFQLCNADWTPAILSQFDFIKGYSQMRLSTYRISSFALTRYTQYQALLPDPNCQPSRSGNYILKVFQNGDTSQLLFTKRMLVLEEKSAISAQIQQPFNGQLFQTHQKVQFKVNLNEQLNVVNHLQQIKVVILQNYRWDNAAGNVQPTFFSRNSMEFNTEADAVFPGGKEWRWLDLRSLRLQTDRVANARYSANATEIFVKPDQDRSHQQFNFYRDLDGLYTIETTESINPYWQGDYATVHFTFIPVNNTPFPDKDIFLFGELTNYDLSDAARMPFNTEKGVYETTAFLKQGYYNYSYVTIDRGARKPQASFEVTEGNSWETENNYTILVYYRSLGGRADELVGYTNVNSLTGRRGIGN